MNCESRYSVVVNGTVPGPEIRIMEGKVSWIRVYNDMADHNLTIHWHGLSAAAAPFSDGTPQVSQWPIPPKHFFDYEVAPEVGLAGTYFYHSHVGMQALSAAGPLIVEDSKAVPYHYDEEKTLLFSDYFNKTDDSMEQGLVANPFKWTGEVNQVLLNGYAMPNGSTSAKVDRASKCALEHIVFQPGKTYRLRFIGGTGLSFLSLAIQGHSSLKLIEADGQYTQPHEVDYIQLGSGQRYSFLLTAKTEAELAADRAKNMTNSYYMQFKTLERPTTAIAYAVIDYPGYHRPLEVPPSQAPLSLPPTTIGWLDYALAPLADNAYPPASAVTRTVTLKIRQQWQNASASQVVWIMQDHTTWTETYRALPPYLVSIYENATAQLPDYGYALAHDGFDERVRAFPARIGEVLDIVLQVEGAAAPAGQDVHPFHMHGRHYWDLGSGNGTYDARANEAKWAGKQPVLRDSTMLFRPWRNAPVGQGAGWRAWRLNVTQPGAWMLHCHTLQHMLMGMQSIWVFGDGDQVRALGQPEVKGYLEYGGNSFGNGTHDPQVNHYYS